MEPGEGEDISVIKSFPTRKIPREGAGAVDAGFTDSLPGTGL